MNVEEYLKMLGVPMQDRVTGLCGMVESVSFDAYGCVQSLLRPPQDMEGKLPDGWWFDVKRLIIDTKRNKGERLIDLPTNFIYGKEIGPANKPVPSLRRQ